MSEQPPLALEASAIASEGSVRSYDPMTRHDDPDRIRSVGETNGSDSLRASDSFGETAV
jgi:hypothetical protein